MAKYIQKEETKYSNNEYENMPSIYNRGERLTTKNKTAVDWDKVGEIVKRHGFDYCLITDTFCSYGERGVHETDFVVYIKMPFTEEWLQEKRKKEEYQEIHKFMDLSSDIFHRLHDCVHELDEETGLFFDTSWAGNCGEFGSDDVKRQSYSFGSSFFSWAYITDRWSPTIHDTLRHLKKGVYTLMDTRYLKENIWFDL